ncbi:hypothetical protein A1O7_03700 [Cladophialophora yegresii CBS 114405]|uniref:Uncharacterized protein n=1 Tax=Cladophialophora yegresii CBS 114405 TaxID=1182544 RepID=W9WM87_9EURO|nr:uncharacterized protein A1O7_03700 [Cladophialophora yegresii CBS 114405]EXJ59554.1 hypothetical protein A1O7_03700 [Cladophialophora yegresii CBS 114405]
MPESPVRGNIDQSTVLNRSSSAGLESAPSPSNRSVVTGLERIHESEYVPTRTRRQSSESLESWHSAQSAPRDKLPQPLVQAPRLEPDVRIEDQPQRTVVPGPIPTKDKVASEVSTNRPEPTRLVQLDSKEEDPFARSYALLAELRAKRAAQSAAAEEQYRVAAANALAKIQSRRSSSQGNVVQQTLAAQTPASGGEKRSVSKAKPLPEDFARQLAALSKTYIHDPFVRYDEDAEASHEDGPAPCFIPRPQPSGESYSAAAQKTAAAVELSNNTKQQLPECTPDNPDVWPFDFYEFGSQKEGHSRQKRFGNHRCACGGFHPEGDCFVCRQMLEVWRRKGSGTGKCTKCGRKDHVVADCGYGEYRDHPSNPPLPSALQRYARPWPSQHPRQPLPAYYYEPRNRRPPSGNPPLSDRFKDGLTCGLLDNNFNLTWSLENAYRMASGAKGRLPFDAKKHGDPRRPLKKAPTEAGEKSSKSDDGQKQVKKPQTVDGQGFTLVNRGSKSADAGFGGLNNVSVGLPSPGYRNDSLQWFRPEFEEATRKCLEPSHARYLGTLKGKFANDKALLASAAQNQAIRASVRQVLATAWEVYKMYIPFWTPSKDWTLPSCLDAWIRSEKTRLIDEACETTRERMVDVENFGWKDFSWDNKVQWSDIEVGDEYTATESRNPQLEPLSDEIAGLQMQDWADHTVLQLHADVQLEHGRYSSEKKADVVKALELFKRPLEVTKYRPADVRKICDDYERTWDEHSRSLWARACSIKDGSINATLVSWEHQRGLIFKSFDDAEKKYAQTRACAFPKGEKGIGHVLEAVAGKDSEVVETLLGAHLPARDVRGCLIPRLAYSRKFAIRCRELRMRLAMEQEQRQGVDTPVVNFTSEQLEDMGETKQYKDQWQTASVVVIPR